MRPPSARTHTIDVKPFTFVGATTRAGLLSAPLRSRFGIVLRLEFYTHDDLKIIVQRSAEILGVKIDDEGARALSAVRMLEGARLYADVVTDKPPGASLFYAAVFALFGRSMKAVHLAAIVWNFVTSVVVYLIAARFYNRRLGLWAALLFAYFSTNYFTQDTMAANTELLMALPYAASFLFFVIGQTSSTRRRSANVALIVAGVLTGFAALFKQVGVLNLGFFAVYEMFEVWKHCKGKLKINGLIFNSLKRAVLRLSMVGVGFAAILIAVFGPAALETSRTLDLRVLVSANILLLLFFMWRVSKMFVTRLSARTSGSGSAAPRSNRIAWRAYMCVGKRSSICRNTERTPSASTVAAAPAT